MSFINFGKLSRALLMAAVLVVGALVGTTAAQQKGTFTDSRDGQKYKTVTIGNQVWMAENLRFKVGDSWCYKNSDENCKKYGRLYDWNTAKTACPSGWHLPSNEEWDGLGSEDDNDNVTSKKLRTKSGWNAPKGQNGNGTDDYGFSALPGGQRMSVGGFCCAGNEGNWWGAGENGSAYLFKFYFGGGAGGNYREPLECDYCDGFTFDEEGTGFSVRCVKD